MITYKNAILFLCSPLLHGALHLTRQLNRQDVNSVLDATLEHENDKWIFSNEN